jgi:hypothetical protein
MQTPEALLRSFEQLYLNITEPLDPFVALALTNLSLRVVETAYTMGFQDGQRGSGATCGVCGDGPCLATKPTPL